MLPPPLQTANSRSCPAAGPSTASGTEGRFVLGTDLQLPDSRGLTAPSSPRARQPSHAAPRGRALRGPVNTTRCRRRGGGGAAPVPPRAPARHGPGGPVPPLPPQRARAPGEGGSTPRPLPWRQRSLPGGREAEAQPPLPRDGVPAGGGAPRSSGRPAGRRAARRPAGPLRRRRQAACTSPRQLGAGAGGRADVGGKLSNNNGDAGRRAGVGVRGAPARLAGLLLFMWGGAKMAGAEAARRT